MKSLLSATALELQEIGDRLDLAELLFRATDADQFYSQMKTERIAYKNCLELVEADARCAIIKTLQAKQKISRDAVLKLKERAEAAAAHQIEVSKTPYLEVPAREVLDSAARDRLADFKYIHMLSAYAVQRAEREREHRKRHKRRPVVDGFMKTGKTVLVDGVRLPIVREMKG